METESKAFNISIGQTIIYNDGRDGHRDIRAEVLYADSRMMQVQFADRMSLTTIYYSEREWMDHIRLENGQ